MREVDFMGRLGSGTNTSHNKEEKLSLVLRNLSGEMTSTLSRETDISKSQIHKWIKQYLEGAKKLLLTSVNQAILLQDMNARNHLHK